MTRTTTTLAALAALGLAASHPAAAQTFSNGSTYYSTGGPFTIDAAHSVTGEAEVGEDSSLHTSDPNTGHPYNPTVNLVAGGSVGQSVAANNASVVNVTGGMVTGTIFTFNTSALNMSGGTVSGILDAADSSTVNVTGGTVTGGLFSYISGEGISFAVSTHVTVSGGTFGQTQGINFLDNTTGSFSLVGTGLSAVATGTDPGLGGTDYRLSGFLQGGQSITGDTINVQPTATMFTLAPAAAPEPSQYAALAIGLLGLGALALKARNRQIA